MGKSLSQDTVFRMIEDVGDDEGKAGGLVGALAPVPVAGVLKEPRVGGLLTDEAGENLGPKLAGIRGRGGGGGFWQ